jgi:hypothetical protein
VQGFSWEKIIDQKAPWAPECRRPEDIACYFEPTDQIGPMEDKYKRPRDKILRDPVCGPTAAEVRKQTAFLGYTFRKSDFMAWKTCPLGETGPTEDRIGGPMSLDQIEGVKPMRPLGWMDTANQVLMKELRYEGLTPTVTLSAF